MNRQPQVSVGILTAQRIGFVLHGDYTAAGKTVAGRKTGFRPTATGCDGTERLTGVCGSNRAGQMLLLR